MTNRTTTTLGDLISVLYEEFMAMYDDEELASVAVAATINDLLIAKPEVEGESRRAVDAA